MIHAALWEATSGAKREKKRVDRESSGGAGGGTGLLMSPVVLSGQCLGILSALSLERKIIMHPDGNFAKASYCGTLCEFSFDF